MWRALGVLMVIAVGLPLTVGLATRGLGRQPLRPLQPSQTVQWLQEQYGLDGRAGMALGASCLVFAIVILCLNHHGGSSPFLIPYGLFATGNAWVQLVYGPRRRRRGAARALELNRRAAVAGLGFRAEDHQDEGGARDSGDGGDR